MYRVAQVCNADARDHSRVAKDGWRADEVVKESNSEAKKYRRDVDVDFVEESSIQQLLDGVSAVGANGLPGGGGVEPAFREGSYTAIELNTSTPVPEWNNQKVTIMMEDDAHLTPQGMQWFRPRQTEFYVIN